MTTSADQTSPVAENSEAPDADSSTKSLEEEGEIAADYLEELLDIADLDGDIEIDVDHGRAAVEILGEEGAERSLRRLAGADGEVLDALQELTRLAVQAKTGDRSRLMLDVAGYRAARRAELVQVAGVAIAAVKASGEPLALAPMNPFERKVVHDAVALAGLVSDSDGVEPLGTSSFVPPDGSPGSSSVRRAGPVRAGILGGWGAPHDGEGASR